MDGSQTKNEIDRNCFLTEKNGIEYEITKDNSNTKEFVAFNNRLDSNIFNIDEFENIMAEAFEGLPTLFSIHSEFVEIMFEKK